MTVTVIEGDCLATLPAVFPDNWFDSCVTDPPYHLTSITKRFGAPGAAPAQAGVYARGAAGFMGQTWDGGDVAFRPETWAEVYRVLKPGAHLLAFGGTRGFHRLACAIEDAGFEIRDTVAWVYGSGFPKSHDVSKGIDRAAGAEREVTGSFERSGRSAGIMGAAVRISRELTAPVTDDAKQWDGWGTALKPAMELVCVARKPLSESTVAANVLRWGTGAINIDACRVPSGGEHMRGEIKSRNEGGWAKSKGMHTPGRGFVATDSPLGRWPANLTLDGSDEVLQAFPQAPGQLAASRADGTSKNNAIYGAMRHGAESQEPRNDSGSAARFFYCAKASQAERAGSSHPTVKPVALMRWLVRLVTPPGGTILDPFAGSGTTGVAAALEGFDAVLLEREPEYVATIRRRTA